jgi:signal transduction histidine kinase
VTGWEDSLRRQGVVFASLAGILMAVAFIVINVLRGLPLVALANAAIVLALLGCLGWLHRGARPVPAAIVVLSLLMLFVVSSLESLGTKALFWPYALPVMAFFLLGTRLGWGFVGVWSAALLAIFTLGGRPAELSLGGRLEMLASFVSVAFVAFLLEHMRGRYVAEITRLALRAETASRAKDRFLAHMSHELRTPLNAILGFSQILRRDEALPGPARSHLDRIHLSGQSLLSLLDTILDYSRLESGDLDHRPGRVDVAELLEEVRGIATVLSAAKGQSLEFEAAETGELWADRRLLKQALLNLISNAVKFTPQGGRVTVTARLEADHQVLGVADTGIGIPAAERESIFQPFAQLDGEGGGLAKGSGLGLVIVKKVVEELHGGRVELASDPGAGAVFTLRLPLAPAAASSMATPATVG